jgi:aminopeptidase-like protein
MNEPMIPEQGKEMHALASCLFPMARSLTGDGVRETLAVLKEHLPRLKIHEVASGEKCFDWTVPDEWNIRDAYIVRPDGEKIAQFKDCNLHVLGYSEPVNKTVSLSELQGHLYSNPDLPDAIPYVTSYYKRQWGFCLSYGEHKSLIEGNYKVFIDSTLEPGSMTYGELTIPGDSKEEIFLSTYICHPSMANNELSGPVVTTFLAKWLQDLEVRRYTYRIVFVPETIGSILYLSRHLNHLKKSVVAGYNVSCVGDDRAYSYLPSRIGDTLSDRIAVHVLTHIAPDFERYSYLDRGSDERQYCSPGVDLPIASVMRSKYGAYPEYHSSKDDLTLVTPSGLQGGYEALRLCLQAIESNRTYQASVLCEPQLGKRNLYDLVGTSRYGQGKSQGEVLLDVLAYCDGRHDLLAVAERVDQPIWLVAKAVKILLSEGLVSVVSDQSRETNRALFR